MIDQAEGARIRREVLGAAYVDSGAKNVDALQQEWINFTETYCWGNVWTRPGLDRKTRSLLNLAMLTAMARSHELAVHVRGALNNGVTKEEIVEVLLQAGVYAGVPVAAEGFRVAREVIAKVEAEGAAR